MNTTTCIILNPAAKGQRAQEFISKIQSRSWNVEVFPTQIDCSGKELAQQAVAKGFKTIIAAGGDGTINEVVNGISGADVSFGILPIGTMNVFAYQMNIPSDMDKAWEVIQKGNTTQIDLAKANDRYFVQLAGVGFDAEVIHQTSLILKKQFGPLSYLFTAFKTFKTRDKELIIKTADKEIHGVSVLIGNGKYYGGPFVIFPKATPHDGLLDICVIKKCKAWQLFWNIAGVSTGKHIYSPYVEYFQTKEVSISSPDECAVEVDGEFIEKGDVKFTIEEKKLRLLVP